MARTRNPPPVHLIPAGAVDVELLHTLGADLEARAGLQWCIGDPLPLLLDWQQDGGMYASSALLDALIASGGARGRSRRRQWRLAIADAALCAPEVGLVFGEAEVGGCCAAIGLEPLRQGSGADPDVLRGRLLTEALHELAHVAGADHCGRPSCVMYASFDIADTDRKEAGFCDDCRAVLKWRGLRES
ncbi:archaemetzincin [Longimicrobium terrae]|uniref:Archaemetzincin n=1 Tax=Longimicrobium terrae TaxID=1639882 RepID=A0A841GPT7_9BACT|nr:archaemetzincin [Longimicrobium terrae]MBB6069000.1 archaemetzincin [Longimicrobium terrae]